MELSRATLGMLPATITRPRYDPACLRAGIVHLGFGGFHRAHMARYTHDLNDRRPADLQWGIIGAGLMAADARTRDALAPQDALYTLIEQQGDERTATVVGSVCKVLLAAGDARDLLAAMEDPAIRIVSLTVTENGYCLNSATKTLDRRHPAIEYDIVHPGNPRSAIGILVEAFRRRMVAGAPAFTAMSCDNIQHNGRVLKEAVLAFAAARDRKLADWIAANASFPNTMVDRITPVLQQGQAEQFAAWFGVTDRSPVFCERFRQWVIEDSFVAGRPAWEEVGAQFVADVAPYEFMKLRLLNASHLALAGVGRLLGYDYIDETVRDPALAGYVRALMDRETGPTLPDVPGVDLDAYKAELIDRFGNAAIKDTVDRVNADAPLNILLDPIRDRLAAGADADLLALALAAWMRRWADRDDPGHGKAAVHPLAGILRERALSAGPDPRPMLEIREVFGALVEHAQFVAAVGTWLSGFHLRGARATLDEARGMLRF